YCRQYLPLCRRALLVARHHWTPATIQSPLGRQEEVKFAPPRFVRDATRTFYLCGGSATLLALLLLSGCQRGTGASTPGKAEPPLDVKVTHPASGEITRSITLPGEIK